MAEAMHMLMPKAVGQLHSDMPYLDNRRRNLGERRELTIRGLYGV
jgi:hypothetical protein